MQRPYIAMDQSEPRTIIVAIGVSESRISGLVALSADVAMGRMQPSLASIISGQNPVFPLAGSFRPCISGCTALSRLTSINIT